MEDKRGRDDGEDRKRKEEAQGARPKKRHSSKSRKSKVRKLRQRFEEPSPTASSIELVMEVVPMQGIMKRRGPMPSTSGTLDLVPHKTTRTKRLSFCLGVKKRSTDDGMDEIDALVQMMAKEGYYFPDHFDWRVPRSQLLRMQISVRLKLDLKWLRFLSKCATELEELNFELEERNLELEERNLELEDRLLLEATSDCVGMILAGLEVEEEESQSLDELDEPQLSIMDGSSSLHSYASCVSAMTDTDNCDSFVTVVSEDATTSKDTDNECDIFLTVVSEEGTTSQDVRTSQDVTTSTTKDETTMLEAAEDNEIIDDSCLDQLDASKEEDRKEDFGKNSKNDNDKAKPWWRRLLSFCSCRKDDTSHSTSQTTTSSKQKSKSTTKQSAPSTRKLGSTRNTRFRQKMC